MSSLLRPTSAWIAVFLLVFGNLLPLGTLLPGVAAMDICTTSAASDAAPARPVHTHCVHCGACQPLTLDLPKNLLPALRVVVGYAVQSLPPAPPLATRMSGNNWARAPPL